MQKENLVSKNQSNQARTTRGSIERSMIPITGIMIGKACEHISQ